MLLLSIPYVQTQLGKKVTNALNETYDTSITVGKVGLNFWGDVALKEILIEDHHKDTLAYIGTLNTSILDFKELSEGDLFFDAIEIDELDFIIKTYKGETDTSLDVFIASFDSKDSIKDRSPSNFLMTSKGVLIENSRFRLIDENIVAPKILDFKKLNIEGGALTINGPNVDVKVHSANMLDHRGLQIEQLKTAFSYTLTQMRFDDIQLSTAASHIYGDLVFDYKRSDFSDFNNKVKLKAKFLNSTIAYADLNHFYDEFGTDVATFSTTLSGTLNDLKLPDLKLKTLNNTVIDGDFNFKNLLSKQDDSFKLVADFDKLKSTYTDLKKMLPGLLGKNIPSTFRNLGVFTIVGNSIITTETITTDVNIVTSIGEVNADLELSNIEDIDQANYVGVTSFKSFDLGKLLDENTLGLITCNVNIDGHGFTLEYLNSLVKGKISSIEINNYRYKNLDVGGEIHNKVFKGNLVVDDQNFQLKFDGLVDMSSKINDYDFKATIDYADFNAINLVSRDSISVFKGDVVMKMKGTGINDAVGEVVFANTYYKNQHDDFYFQDFKVTSSFDDERIRTIAIHSPEIINGTIVGKFRFEELFALAQNDLGSIYTNYRPIRVAKDQFFDFNIKIENKLTEIFYPDIVIHNKAVFKGKVSSKVEDFKLNVKSSKISFQNNSFENINIQLDNSNPLFNAFVGIDNVKTDFYNVSEFNLINKTISDTLFFRTEFKGGKLNNDSYNLNLYHTINAENKSVIGFKKSDVTINDYNWFINEQNTKNSKLVFDKDFKDIYLKEFIISHGAEFLKLKGELHGTEEKNITLNVKDARLSKLIPEIKHFKFKGLANGDAILLQQKGIYKPSAGLTISDFNINDHLLGDFTVNVEGNDEFNNYKIRSNIINDNLQSFSANGSLDVSPNVPQLKLDLALEKFDLSFFSSLGEDVISNIRGFASGNATLFGDYDNPDFSGQLSLDEAGLYIPYLNIDFDVENDAIVNLENKRFICDNIAILDTKHYTSGRLNGFVEHNYFTDWELGLKISSNNLLVLDKKQEENSLYYGKAFIAGTAELLGPTSELLVKVDATTKENTVFKIPISDSESVGDNSFIKTISKHKKLDQTGVDANLPKDISGLELEFDLNVTPDAEIEIVLDQDAGSVLKGRGAGLMRIEINTNDKFNMYGDFMVSEGTYNFVYGNNFLQGGFIEKRFAVKPGGTINWDGNPFNARLNMAAVYSTMANPAILLDNPSINRKIPVDVVIHLNGGLMQPNVNFDIQFPKTNSVAKSELLYKLDDKEFRDKQALSLVTSGQFTGAYSYGQSAVTGNLVERATILVNNMLSKADDKFKIGLNYEQGENNPLEEQRIEDRFGFTVSTQISDRILINGKVGIPVGGVSKTVVAGDVQVEFLLNEDGTLRAKIFNRENDLTATELANEIGYTQGVGISYKVDFDNFEELINKIFKGKRKTAEKEEQKEEDPSSFIREKKRK
ncbi:MAG: translocation/assembly module TamB domain-containing protein [Flavobacteriaceae bacterium]